MLCQWGGTQKCWEHGLDGWPKPAKGIFHILECPAQCINWESYLEGADRVLTPVSRQWAIVLRITYLLFFLLLLLFFTIIIIFHFASIIKLLSQPACFTFAFPSHHTRVGRWASGCGGVLLPSGVKQHNHPHFTNLTLKKEQELFPRYSGELKFETQHEKQRA